MIDHGEFGIEIVFLDYSKLKLHGDEAQVAIQELKSQIRSRKDWTERSEHWEGYETQTDVYANNPNLEGRVYSFDKEMGLLRSRMTRQEKEEVTARDL